VCRGGSVAFVCCPDLPAVGLEGLEGAAGEGDEGAVGELEEGHAVLFDDVDGVEANVVDARGVDETKGGPEVVAGGSSCQQKRHEEARTHY
jgi:hypothetical protein